MTSLETLLAAANFVEANDRPDNLARENILSLGSTNTQLSIFTSQHGQLSSVLDLSESENAEESKGRGGVCQSASSCFIGNTRQVHNKLEKNRRAVLKDCFEGLKKEIPSSEDRKSSHLDVLRTAAKYVKMLKVKSKELERSRARLRQQNCSLQQRLVALQLSDTSVAPPTSSSTDTADDSPCVSDEELGTKKDASSCPLGKQHAAIDHSAGGISIHSGTKQSSATVSRSLTIAELTGSCQPLAPQPNVAGQQSASGRICSSGSNFTHSTDTVNCKIRSGPRHGRTVVQMLQNSLVQKALNQEIAASDNCLNCSKAAVSQTQYAKLSTSVAAAIEVISPGQLSPGVLMPATAAGGFLLTLDQQQAKDIRHLALTPAAQPHCAVSTSSTSSQEMSSVLAPTVGQLVLCPTPTAPSQFAYQSSPLTIAAAVSTPSSNSAAQFCTVLGPMTSVPVLHVPALVQSVQVMPAAVGVPVSPVFIAGNVSGASSLFMVPN